MPGVFPIYRDSIFCIFFHCRKGMGRFFRVSYSPSLFMQHSVIHYTVQFRGVSTKRPAKGLILHPDRGSQYCAHDYRKLPEQFGMAASMSRKGDCWDNLPMESLGELVHHRRYRVRMQAIQEITGRLGILCNRGSENRRASATCHPLLSRSDIMKICSPLNPLDSTIANRPHQIRCVEKTGRQTSGNEP